MPTPVKKLFRLRKSILNNELAKKLRLTCAYQYSRLLLGNDGHEVAWRVSKTLFAIHIDETELHELALGFAENAGER